MKETIVKKLNKASAAARMSSARRASLTGVRVAAFASGVSRSTVIAATFAACGKRPVLALYNAAKLELQIGFMGAALARKGDNREPDAVMEHCRERLTSYAGFGGTAKLKAGQKGRRTKAEEDAYSSARVLVSGVMKEAGVAVPEARGGNTSATRKPGGKTNVSASKGAAKAATEAKPSIRRYKDKPALIEYLGIQAAAMLANINRNAAIAPIEAKSAVQDFHARIKALAA